MASSSEDTINQFVHGAQQAPQQSPRLAAARARVAQAGQQGQAQGQQLQAQYIQNQQNALRAKSAAITASAQQKLADEQAKQAQKDADAAARASAEATGALAAGAMNIGDSVSDAAQGFANWAGSLPTPGGIGLILLAIFVLLWAVIPVDKDGHTRLQLLWLTVTGQTQIHGSPSEVSDIAAKAAAGLFPDTPTTNQSPIAGIGSIFNTNVPMVEDFSS